MTRFFAGVIVGIVLATIGVDGVANLLHKAAPQVNQAVSQVKEMANEANK